MDDRDLKKIGELIDQRLSASEERMSATIDQRLSASEERITGDIGRFIEDQLFPMIDEKADKEDLYRLERKLDQSLAKLADHDKDIQRIKAIPYSCP